MMDNKESFVALYEADWCGACKMFDKHVMSHMKNLENKTLKIARISSNVAFKTGLPPPEHYPTLLHVKNGTAEPIERGKSLEEDRINLTNLVKTPDPNGSANKSLMRNSRTVKKNMNTLSSTTPKEITLPTYDKQGSPPRSTVSLKSLAKSPYDTFINGMPSKRVSPINSKKESNVTSIPVINPPDVSVDLQKSTLKSSENPSTRGGGLLSAIYRQINSLKSLVKLRKTRKR
jgi:hypothetical protein